MNKMPAKFLNFADTVTHEPAILTFIFLTQHTTDTELIHVTTRESDNLIETSVTIGLRPLGSCFSTI
jgi:hypothetical protein